jgi:hypothetical protein
LCTPRAAESAGLRAELIRRAAGSTDRNARKRLLRELDDVLPTLASRKELRLLEIAIEPDSMFAP